MTCHVLGIIALLLLFSANGFPSYALLKYYSRKFVHFDGSTAAGFLNIGDEVRVLHDVFHLSITGYKFSSKGMTGIIDDIWVKCEVDPHCCCAELAFDAPVRQCCL